MVEDILASYGQLQPPIEIHQINNGLINQTWRIKNSHGEYILQKINGTIFRQPSAIANNIRLISDYLSQHFPGYLFVTPIQTIHDEEMALYSQNYFRLMPFVKNSHTVDFATNPDQAFEAATAFGKFTKLLACFPIEKLQVTLPDFHNLTLRYNQFENALNAGNTERLHKATDLIHFLKANQNIVQTYQNILDNPAFKLRVTHHDTKISNILFDNNNKGLCVIDLDTVMPGYFISDVGDMMRTYLSPVTEEEKDFDKIEIREEYFHAIWKGYTGEMKNELTEEELNHFIYAGKFMIYMQAIRFATDYLLNDIYYSAKYPDHNFVRAKNQQVLLERLSEKEQRLKEVIG